MEDVVESLVGESVWPNSMFKEQFEEELEKMYAAEKAKNYMVVKRSRAQRILTFLKGGKETGKFKQTITRAGFQRMVVPSVSSTSSSDEEQQEEEVLFRKVNASENDHAKNTGAIGLFRRVAIYEDFFGIITQFHNPGTEKHLGVQRTFKAIADQYTCLPRSVVRLYVELCPNCPNCHPKRTQGITPPLQPILSPELINSRYQSQPSAASNTPISSASPTEVTTVAATLPPPSSATAAAQTAAEEIPNKKRKTTDVLLTEYQRQKLQKLDVQNQLLRNLCAEIKLMRADMNATYDVQVAQGSK